MKRRKRVVWNSGDIFSVRLKNNKYATGQVLGQRMVNAVRIALFNETLNDNEDVRHLELCDNSKLISLVEVTKEQLDFGVWKVIGNTQINIPISKYPNEQYRSNNWIGSVIYDAALAEDFLNAFYALIPWDDWYDPNFLNEFLTDISKKPKNLILVKC